MYSNSGPPQPEWRLPPRPPTTATGTTTATTATSTPSTSPVPPPHPPAPSAPAIPSYNPNAFGPMPGVPPVATGIDTTAWGVKFNQHQHHQAHSPPPPLPVSASHGLLELSQIPMLTECCLASSSHCNRPCPGAHPVSASQLSGVEQTLAFCPPVWRPNSAWTI